MAKKKTTKKSMSPKSIAPADKKTAPQTTQKVSPEMEKKLKETQKTLNTFKDKLLEKFGDYIIGITLLPPEKPKEGEKEPPKDQISLLVVVDDTTSKKMSKDELYNKFSKIVADMAAQVDKKIKAQSMLLTDIWQNCYDGKTEVNRLISMSAPIHDVGHLAAIRIAEIHKSMVIKKFDKYILSYVLAGSLMQGRATPQSDIDVWIVIDDTDVKKMTRAELKDKLRAIIIGMGAEAGQMTGITNKLNIQVYILTDFWDSLKEANPIIFTLLRDGVPFYDRGVFMPWKQLLRMGRIKPSREAIDIFMSSGEQSIKRAKRTLNTLGMEDTYYAILTPTQAAIMLYGLPPPTPRETPEVLEDIFVKKEKMLEKEYVKILNDNVQLRKDIEHGTLKQLSGAKLDKYLANAEKYLKRINKLFDQIEGMHNEKSILHLYDEVMTFIRDVLKLEGIEKAQDEELIKLFEDELISSGKVPARYLRDLNEIVDAKRKHDTGKLTKPDIEKARKGSGGLLRFLIEYMQRKRGRALERAKIRVKYGEKYGEVILLAKEAFVFYDIDNKEEQRIEKAKVNPDGSFATLKSCSLEVYEKALAKTPLPERALIKEPVFEELKRIFGKDVEIFMS